MAIGDVFRMAIVSRDSAESNEVVNVHHFQQVAALVLDTPPEDLAAAWIDQCLGPYTALFGANMAVRELQVRSLATPVTGTDVPVTGGTGTASGSEYLPRTVSGVITWRTAFIGRSYRGRTYLPPGTELIQNDGFVTTGYATGMQNYADAMLGMASETVTSAGWRMVIHSSVLSTNTPVTFAQIRTLLGGQNRRRQGRGS